MRSRLLIDLSSAQPQKPVIVNGGGEYAYRLFEELNNSQYDKEIDVLLNSNLGDNSKILSDCITNNIGIILYNDVSEINDIVNKGKYDIVVFPVCYSKYCNLKINDDVKVVTIIHDLCEAFYSELKPQYGRYTNGFFWNSIRRIKNAIMVKHYSNESINSHNKLLHIGKRQIIVTVSYFSRNSFRYFLDVKENEYRNIHVCYTLQKHCEVYHEGKENVCGKYGLTEEKYFLLCSACRWTKNNAIAIFSLDELFCNPRFANILKGYKVLVIGATEEYKKYCLKRIKNPNRFIFVGYVEECELIEMYSHMHMLIFPSLLEGFGLPPIEAMKYGKVSACSAEMSMPEICGDAAIYFNPYNKESIKRAIIQSLDSDYMETIIDKVRIRNSWIENRRRRDLERLISLIFE